MTKPNRPTRRFEIGHPVWSPDGRRGVVISWAWADGTWSYGVSYMPRSPRVLSYAEYELEAAR